MSAWTLEKESLENLAESIAYAVNHVGGFWYAQDIKEAFEDCKDFYGDLSAKKLAAALYEMNVSAVNQRHNENNPTDDITFSGNGKNYLLNATVQSLCQFAKTLRCFLYQCTEGDVPVRESFKALDGFSNELFQCIVHKLPAYNEAKWG